VHLNETRTDEQDEHLPVGLGFVDFDAIAAAMVETGWSGTCTHELWPYRPDYVAESLRHFRALLDDAAH
jgi:sugar phosphate isomerase/epimerase